MSVSAAEEALAEALAADPMPGWDLTRQFRFHPERRWAFDFAFPSQKLAVEVDGRGRHQTVVGVREACEKLNEATIMGWKIMRFPATDARRRAGEWAMDIKRALVGTEEEVRDG